ncbi:MAG: nitroreductase family protein [Lachnospiraceae bacterium]
MRRTVPYTTSKKDKWEMFDAGIASQTFMLAAHEYGVGTVTLGIFDEEILGKILELPEGDNVSALLAAGYPESAPAAPKKRAWKSFFPGADRFTFKTVCVILSFSKWPRKGGRRENKWIRKNGKRFTKRSA